MELVGQLGVGRRVDVDLRALVDLGRELVGAGEREPARRRSPRPRTWARTPRAPRSWTRRRRPPAASAPSSSRRRVVVAAAARRAERQRSTTPHELVFTQQSLSTITEVALTAAVAFTPGASPSSSTASRVIGGGDQERPGLDLDQRHHAVDLHRADDAREAVARRAARRRSGGGSGCPARRSTSRRGTRRRLAASRRVRSLPSRSQRRSVSWLTPIARAASPSSRPSSRSPLPKHCICKYF